MSQKNGLIPACKVIAGHGAHIKATREYLRILQKGVEAEILLAELDHLLIIGGHNIQTSAITTLLHKNIFISFLESDGEPSGYLIPYGYKRAEEIGQLRENASPYSYALAFAKGAMRERMLAIEQWNDEHAEDILYSGELDILDQAIHEIDNFIKIEEINRVDRLIGDMYYEIMSRLINPVFQYKRRTQRPYPDPINAILSFGYAILLAYCTRILVSFHLDPDNGMLNRGKRSLALDFSNCWKTRMIDLPVLEQIHNGSIMQESYECGEKRCILSEPLINQLIHLFEQSIKKEVIQYQVETFLKSLSGESGFEIHRI